MTSLLRTPVILALFCFVMDVAELFKKLKIEAECPLCKETVENPKTLPCLHSFCLECLDKQAILGRGLQETTIKCPVCQSSFPIPESDTFESLPSSFHLNRLLEVISFEKSSAQPQKCHNCVNEDTATSYCFVCRSFLCACCNEAHRRLKATRGHRNVLIDRLQAQDVEDLIHRPGMCSRQYHESQPLIFYCEDCKVPICYKCSEAIHNGHRKTDAKETAREKKMQIAEAMAKVKDEVVVYENEIKKQTELKKQREAEIMNAEKKYTDNVEDLIHQLREHESNMKSKIREMYNAEEEADHRTRLEDIQLIANQLRICMERGQRILETDVTAEVQRAGSCNPRP